MELDFKEATETADLPAGWEWKKLGELAPIITKGTTPTTNGFKYQESGIRFVKIENLKENKVDHDSIEHFISEDAHNAQKRSILQEGDLLFSIAGTIGNVAKVCQADLPANTNQALAIIRGFQNRVDADYLIYFLKSKLVEDLLKKARGGALQNISLGDLKECSILLPPLAEQQRIVAKLDALFTRIDEAKKIAEEKIRSLDNLKGSLLYGAFEGGL